LPSKPFTFAAFNRFSTNLQEAIQHRLALTDLEVIYNYLEGTQADHLGFIHLLDELIYLSEKLTKERKGWFQYFSDIQIKHLLHALDDDRLEHIQETINRDFPELVEFDKLRKKLRPMDLELMGKILDKYPEKDFASLKAMFLAGLKRSEERRVGKECRARRGQYE